MLNFSQCEDPENSVRGFPDKVFLVAIVFHRGPNGPPSRSNWTQVQLLLEGYHWKYIAT